MDMNLVNEITREIWNNAKEYYNLSDKVDCLRLIKDLFMLLDTKETSMKIMEKEIESASIKTKELEKQLQKEAMRQLSLLDQIKELEGGIEILKELCQLKKYKDEVGKDSFYQKRQPELWKLANEFLNQH